MINILIGASFSHILWNFFSKKIHILLVILFQISTPRKVLEMRHRHIAPSFWKYKKVYIATQPNYHHPRSWEMGHRRKKYFSIYVTTHNASEGVGNETTMDNSTLNSYRSVHSSSCNPQPPETMRNVTLKKIYFSTFQLSTPRKVLEIEQQWTTRY